MSTAFKVLLDTLSAALLQSPAIASGRVSMGNDNPTPLDKPSDVTITLQAQDGEPFALTGGPTDWTTDIGVEIRARGTSSLDAIAAIDPLIELAYARITTMALPAGVTGLTSLRAKLDVQEAATPVAAWLLLATFTFRTAPGSLALAP